MLTQDTLTRNTRTGLATLALTGLLLAGLSACGDDTEPTSGTTQTDPGAPTSTSATADPTDTTDPASPTSEPGTPSASATEPTDPSDGPGSDTVAAPVYFVGDSPLGPRLYREFHQVSADDALTEAARVLVDGDALDPDYGTLLQGVTIASVTEGDGEIVVTLGDDSPLTADKGTSAAEARLAVQSLVYTLQGTSQTRDKVRTVLSDGSAADLFGQRTGRGVRAAAQLDVLALVSLTTPEEGATASGTLRVQGVASSFEATVPYEVLDASGRAVITDSTMAEQSGDRLYPFSVDIDISDLAPGTYTLVARTDDPTGGTEGPGPFEDTRTFVIG